MPTNNPSKNILVSTVKGHTEIMDSMDPLSPTIFMTQRNAERSREWHLSRDNKEEQVKQSPSPWKKILRGLGFTK